MMGKLFVIIFENSEKKINFFYLEFLGKHYRVQRESSHEPIMKFELEL